VLSPLLYPTNTPSRLQATKLRMLIEMPDNPSSTLLERFDPAWHLKTHFGQAARR
jgi:hypothetical protein